MPILEQVPEKKVLSDTYRKISSTKVTSSDPMVSHLCDLADQLRDHILVLENLRTRDLAKVLAKADSTLTALSPQIILELRQALEAAENEEDRASLKKSLTDLEAEQENAKVQFNDLYFQTVKQLRNKCYAVSQSSMADYIIETLADRRKTLDRLTKLSEKTLLPLMKNLEDQISGIDAELAKKLDENIFETVLRLLPDENTLTELVKKMEKTPKKSAGATPATPAAAAQLPDEGEAAKAVAKNTDAPKPLGLTIVVPAGDPAPTPEPAPASNAPSAPMTASVSSLISAIPEEEALKLAYRTLQNALSCISESVTVSRQISRRLKLRESLDELRKKYSDVQQQYRTVSFDIEDLDRLYQFLNQVGTYFEEAEKLDITLTAYAEALNTASADPAAYYGIFLMLRQYMQKLELYWR